MVAKKSLIVFSVVMLLISMSFVSAGFWDWLTGDATIKEGKFAGTTSTRTDTNGDTSTRLREETLFRSFRDRPTTFFCPRGWTLDPSSTADKKCCIKKPATELGCYDCPPSGTIPNLPQTYPIGSQPSGCTFIYAGECKRG